VVTDNTGRRICGKDSSRGNAQGWFGLSQGVGLFDSDRSNRVPQTSTSTQRFHPRTTMASGEIDITKLSNEQLDGLRKQTESVGLRAVRLWGCHPVQPICVATTRVSFSLPRTLATQEVKNLGSSLNALRVAQSRFQESAASLAAIPADGEGE